MMKAYYRFCRPTRWIYLDESFFTTQMTRLYGYAPRSERLVDFVPQGHWRRLTLVAGLCTEGVLAPWTFEGSMTTDRMLEYLQNHLGPELRPGDALVMDNLNVHKSPRVREALRDWKADRLLLPAYSPDLNPIEQVFSWLKGKIRQIGPQPVEALQASITRCLTRLGVRKCQHWIQRCKNICYRIL
jgi:transposase